jgi:hypothetical protein
VAGLVDHHDKTLTYCSLLTLSADFCPAAAADPHFALPTLNHNHTTLRAGPPLPPVTFACDLDPAACVRIHRVSLPGVGAGAWRRERWRLTVVVTAADCGGCRAGT